MAGKLKMLLSTTLVLLLLAAGLVAYLWIDRSVTESYGDESYELEKSSNRLAGLIEQEWKGVAKDEVLRRLNTFASEQGNSSAVVFEDEEDGTVRLGAIVFEFDEERLTAVRVRP